MFQRAGTSSGGGGGMQVVHGTINASNWSGWSGTGNSQTATCTITGLGFKPKYLVWFNNGAGQYSETYWYDESLGNVFNGTYSSTKFTNEAFTANAKSNNLCAVGDDGFTLKFAHATYKSNDIDYWAMG